MYVKGMVVAVERPTLIIENLSEKYQWDLVSEREGPHELPPILLEYGLKMMVLQHFLDSEEGSLLHRLFAVKQRGKVAEYRAKFELLVASAGKLDEAILTAIFINGLEETVRAELFLLNPIGLKATIQVATRIEKKNFILNPTHSQKWPPDSPPSKPYPKTIIWTPPKNYPNSSKQSSLQQPVSFALPFPTRSSASSNHINLSENPKSPTSRFTPRFNPRYRILSETEAQAKRDKGLCYGCDEKWSTGHHCKNREFHVLIVGDNKDDIGAVGISAGVNRELDGVELSMNSVMGLTEPRTLKLSGDILGKEMVVLIDCGVTHNFISMELVELLPLLVSETGNYGVVMGNGRNLKGKGICMGVTLEMQGLVVVEDYLLLQMKSSDVILGIKWLSTLGVTRKDWKPLTMSFEVDGKPVELRGDPSLYRSLVSFKTILKDLWHEKEGVLIELCSLETTEEVGAQILEEIQKLLFEFEDIFTALKGLPPIGSDDHAITLLDGTGPINVRPYWYPNAQKNEIEKLILDMLVELQKQLPAHATIHPVFYVSQLKKVMGTSSNQGFPLLLFFQDVVEWLVEHETVLYSRMGSCGTEVLIKWKELPSFESTWELIAVFHLEDKVNFQGGRNDRHNVHNFYQRRKFRKKSTGRSWPRPSGETRREQMIALRARSARGSGNSRRNKATNC